MATIEDLREFQDELKAKFGADASVAYANVSMTQLSVARHYGGANVQGKHFVYNPTDDSLIREDVVKWIAKKRKTARPDNDCHIRVRGVNMAQIENGGSSTSDHDFVCRPRRSKMEVIDFIHGGYVCDGTAWMDVRLRCPKCGKETGWRRDKRTPTYCDHQ